MLLNSASTTTGANMVGYRCYILDAEDHILQAHDLDCDGDGQAESAAEHLLSQDPYHQAVEVWRATRRVAQLKRGPTQALRAKRREGRTERPINSAI